MIRILLIISALFCLVYADTRPKVTFAPAVLQVLRSSMKKCLNETGVDPHVIYITEEGGYKTDEAFKKFVHCVYITSGFSNNDGSVKEKEAISIFPEEYKKVPEVIEKCNQVKADNPVETTFKFFTCFQDNSPVIMAICFENGDKNKNACK